MEDHNGYGCSFSCATHNREQWLKENDPNYKPNTEVCYE